MEACEYGLTRGMCSVARSEGGRGRRAAVDFVVCFGCGEIYFVFFRVFPFFSPFFSSNAHGLLQV